MNTFSGLKNGNEKFYPYLSTSHYMRTAMGTEKPGRHEDPTGECNHMWWGGGVGGAGRFGRQGYKTCWMPVCNLESPLGQLLKHFKERLFWGRGVGVGGTAVGESGGNFSWCACRGTGGGWNGEGGQDIGMMVTCWCWLQPLISEDHPSFLVFWGRFAYVVLLVRWRSSITGFAVHFFFYSPCVQDQIK